MHGNFKPLLGPCPSFISTGMAKLRSNRNYLINHTKSKYFGFGGGHTRTQTHIIASTWASIMAWCWASQAILKVISKNRLAMHLV